MIPELKMVYEVSSAKRFLIKDATPDRLTSFREATIDFCRRCKSPVQPMNSWEYISKVIRGQESAELWWAYEGDHINGFSVNKVYQDFDGLWTVYFLFGWSDCPNGREYFKTMIEDYEKKGIHRFQFISRRDPKVFNRWAGVEWKPVATTFELRR